MDVITKMFNEGKACVLKMNPVNAYLGPFLERAFADAIRAGYLAVVYGGAEEGAYLAGHAGVDEIHLTGSDRTYDQIVWGPPGPEREARKRDGRPSLTKPVTAELGGVAPVIVVPGPYSDKELAFQAEDVASGLTFNASFDCNANRVVVLPRGWSRRDEFLGRLRSGARARCRSAGLLPRRAGAPGALRRRAAAPASAARPRARCPGPSCRGSTTARRPSRCSAEESFAPSSRRPRSAARIRPSSSRRPSASPTTGSGARFGRAGGPPQTMKDPAIAASGRARDRAAALRRRDA